MNKQLLIRAWVSTLSRLEKRLQIKYARQRSEMIKKAAKAYESTGGIAGNVFASHQNAIEAMLIEHYQITIPAFGKMALAQIRRISRKAAEDIFMSMIGEWITREAFRKAKQIADTDREQVIDALADGIREGDGIPSIAKRIREVSTYTGYRSAMVARTETHAAATYGSVESARAAERDFGVKMMKEWVAVKDTRTRDAHLAVDGDKVAMDDRFYVGGEYMDRPGDPSGSPENVVNCLHPDTAIQSGKIHAVTRRWYEGALIVIETESGNKLTVTPNHPILTRRGWMAAAMLQEGNSVIGGSGFDGARLGDLDVNYVVATAKQMYDSLDVLGGSVRVARTHVDFHGERPDSDVDVVNAACHLWNPIVSALAKPLQHFRLACTDFGKGRLLAECLLLREGAVELRRKLTHSLVRGGHKCFAFIKGCSSHSGEHAVAAVAGLDSVVGQAKGNMTPFFAERLRKSLHGLASKKASNNLGRVRISLDAGRNPAGLPLMTPRDAVGIEGAVNPHGRDAILGAELRNAGSRQVFLDPIVAKSHIEYSGYVYNLESSNGYYIGNGVVQHNCRCGLTYSEVE